MKHNKKKISEWTAWDWFVDDIKSYLADPLTWLTIFMILTMTVAIVMVIILIVKASQAPIDSVTSNYNNRTFWTLYNLQTVLRNLK